MPLLLVRRLRGKRAILAGLLQNVEIEDQGAHEIARRSRGTPRIANKLLRRVRDYAQVRHQGRITAEVADQALAMLEIDQNGLDEMDKRLLQTIIEKFAGTPPAGPPPPPPAARGAITPTMIILPVMHSPPKA